SYHVVEKMAKDLNCTIKELIDDKSLREKIDLKKYTSDTIGLATLTDILGELEKPGRDPRTKVQMFEFNAAVKTIDDLNEGMILPGIVTNITNFGCFVDVGIKENGLVHISELADRFVSNPTEVVSLHQHVQVKVLSVDKERKRIQLSMRNLDS
ncbi:MAG: S1 RNA-binding domain-containing protein, partial [Dysgonamonadaceae bacterium]|nr:S1 RNA-binding domain-containing protein [Dysgonamonadaceae bacterium]